VHLSEVRVQQAFSGVQGWPCRCFANARRNHRTIKGDPKLERASARLTGHVRLSSINERAGPLAGTLEAGSDTLRAKKKTATLHCYRLDPNCPEMQQRRRINS